MKLLKNVAVSIFISTISLIVATYLEVFFISYCYDIKILIAYRHCIIYPIILFMSYLILRRFIKADEFLNNFICIIEINIFDYLMQYFWCLFLSKGMLKTMFVVYLFYVLISHIILSVIIVINIIWVKRKAIKERIFSFK